MNLKVNEILSKKHQWLIVLLVGVLLMVIAIPSEKKKIEKNLCRKFLSKMIILPTLKMERRLEKALGQVAGVGEARVMITLKSTAEKVIEKDGRKYKSVCGGGRCTGRKEDNRR